MKLTVSICAHVLQQGVVKKIGEHSKNFAMMQNKLGQTIKSYIMTITGNLELSKEVLHKSLNFMCSDDESNR